MHSPETIRGPETIRDMAGLQPTTSRCADPTKAPLAQSTATRHAALAPSGDFNPSPDPTGGRTMTFPSAFPALERAPTDGRRHSSPDPAGRAHGAGKRPSRPFPRPSLRAAIDGFCRHCIYDPMGEGRWREQIAACEAGNCPLHPVRPIPRDVAPGSPALAALRLRLDPIGGA